MRHFVLKLSDGFYYKTGHAVGQAFHLANIYPDEKMIEMIQEMGFVKENVDNNVKLIEIIIKENSMMKEE